MCKKLCEKEGREDGGWGGRKKVLSGGTGDGTRATGATRTGDYQQNFSRVLFI